MQCVVLCGKHQIMLLMHTLNLSQKLLWYLVNVKGAGSPEMQPSLKVVGRLKRQREA